MMPPQIHSCASSLTSASISLSSSHSFTCSSSLITTSLFFFPSLSHPSKCRLHRLRQFSSSPRPQTRLRSRMFDWLNGEGAALKTHLSGSTNYLTGLKERNASARAQEKVATEATSAANRSSAPGENVTDGEGSEVGGNRPFPLNPSFISESILSKELRNAIYQRVVTMKKSVRAVSVELGVDMRRVGAVVRLVELEKRWRKEGKPLALPYARAIHEMVQTTPLCHPPQRQIAHESINDLTVHRLTDPQIFYPVSESRQFTRVDAGRIFSGAPALEHREASEGNLEDPSDLTSKFTRYPERIERVGKGNDEHEVLLPADARIPHPHLIAFERDRLRAPSEHRDRMKRYEERLKAEEAAEQERKQHAKERWEKSITKIEPENSRFEFRFKDVIVSRETTGADGRGSAAPGRRYGVPTYDRKKGRVKIPTKVEV